MDDFSPGCLLVFLLLGAAAVAIVALRRSLAADRARAVERRIDTARLLAERGWTARAEAPFPAGLPDLPLVPRGGRPRLAVEIELDGVALWVFEHCTSGRTPMGRNVEVRGPDDDGTSRHTIACLRDARLELPLLEILPGLRGAFRAAGFEVGEDRRSRPDEPGAKASASGGQDLARLVWRLCDLADRMDGGRAPLTWSGREDFADAYRVFGKDLNQIRRHLTDPIIDWLVARPGTIACAAGAWLLLSRNVRVAPSAATEDLEHGWLAPDGAAELAFDAAELAALLREQA